MQLESLLSIEIKVLGITETKPMRIQVKNKITGKKLVKSFDYEDTILSEGLAFAISQFNLSLIDCVGYVRNNDGSYTALFRR